MENCKAQLSFNAETPFTDLFDGVGRRRIDDGRPLLFFVELDKQRL